MTNAAIIADSSPLISLAIIEQLELLPQLYQRILLPPAVWDFDRVFMGRSHPFSSSKAIWTTFKDDIVNRMSGDRACGGG